MTLNFENKPKIGIGIYTSSEISKILRVPYSKVYTWMNKYWDGKLGTIYGSQYSWQAGGTRAVSFHTFVEFYVMMRFSEAGVKPKQVLEAHNELVKMYGTAFPFAHKDVLDGIRCDGKRIFLETIEGTIELNGKKQFELSIIKLFFVRLDFDKDDLASRYWPMGKSKAVIVDPKRKFGRVVLYKRNIYPEVLYSHYKAGDSIIYLSAIYELDKQDVNDAIEYCKAG